MFWVIGGYITATGVLVIYVASTGLHSGGTGALAVLTVAWAASIGWMTVVNIAIDPDFKRPLTALAVVSGPGHAAVAGA